MLESVEASERLANCRQDQCRDCGRTLPQRAHHPSARQQHPGQVGRPIPDRGGHLRRTARHRLKSSDAAGPDPHGATRDGACSLSDGPAPTTAERDQRDRVILGLRTPTPGMPVAEGWRAAARPTSRPLLLGSATSVLVSVQGFSSLRSTPAIGPRLRPGLATWEPGTLSCEGGAVRAESAHALLAAWTVARSGHEFFLADLEGIRPPPSRGRRHGCLLRMRATPYGLHAMHGEVSVRGTGATPRVQTTAG